MKYAPEFIPMSRAEMDNWAGQHRHTACERDAYVDHPSFGICRERTSASGCGLKVGNCSPAGLEKSPKLFIF
jgi:hypothetical protein